MARLGDICTVKSGYAFKSEHFSDEGIPVIRIGNITNDGLSLEDAVCFDEDFWENNSNYRVHPNDILIAMSGATVGKSCLNESNEKLLLNQRVAAITAGNGVNVKYIFHIINSDYFTNYVLQNSAGCAQPNISTKQLMNFEIRDVSRIIQDSIANTLDAVDELITLRKEQLAKLDQLVKSQFIELFGEPIANQKNLPVKTLKEISTLITNGNTPKGGSENYVENGITFLRSQNVWRNKIVLDDVAYIDEETHESMKKSSVHHKDILITKTGRINTENSSLGRAALYLGEDDSANINGHVYLVRLDDTVVPEYVVTILTGEAYRRYIRKVCVGGIDKRQINLDQVEEFPIILPPKEQQEQFADFARQIDKSKLAIQQSLDKLELLKKSLMQEYFG